MSETFLRRAAFFGLGGAFLGAISRLTIVDLDLFHEMALVREAFRAGFLPRVDTFSYLPTVTPVVHHEWGTGLILYLLCVQLGLGAAGLMILKYLLAAFIAVGCWFFATRRGAGCAVFSFLAPLGLAMGWGGFSTIRAQLFTLSFLIIFLFLMEADRRGKGWALWAWLPLYVIWLNLHGGFLLGLGLLAVYCGQQFFLTFLGEKNFLHSLQAVKRPIWFFLATGLLTLANPYGTDYIPYIWHAVTLDRTPFIPEWRPLWQVSWPALWLWLCSLAVVLYAAGKKGLGQEPGLFIIAATAWFALWHYRHLSIFGVAWMCYAPLYLENTPLGDLINKFWRENSRLVAAVFVIIGLAGTFYAVRNQFWQIRIPITAEEGKEGVPVYPAGVVGYLKDRKFSGNLMVPFSTGAYVSWHLYPEVKVSLDSRFEVAYPVETVAESQRFYGAAEGWRETLGKYRTDAVLIPRGSNLDRAMAENTGGMGQRASLPWVCVYVDDGFSLYLRSDLAEKFPSVDRRGKPIPARFP